MSATDIDDGENAAISFSLEPDPSSPEDEDYFRIDNGQIYLAKSLSSVRQLGFFPHAFLSDPVNFLKEVGYNRELMMKKKKKKRVHVFKNNDSCF